MKYRINRKLFEPIKMGDSGDWYEEEPSDSTKTCGDCGCHMGEAHLDGCDIERCPNCHGQLISCGCSDENGIEVVNNDEE